MPASWISPRVPGAGTDGPVVAAFTREQLGVKLMPWQRDALGVALQHRRGRRLYRDVTVTVPRQSGKSTLILALAVWTMTTGPDRRVVYGAQSKIAARQKLLRTWWPAVARSPLADQFTIHRANGAEALRCANGSELVLLSAEESTGHGETADLVFLDEAWTAPDERIETAARPMLATIPNGQLWALSTAGSSQSTWWWDRLAAARTCAELGMPDGHALVEWSAADGADPFDPAVWRACMPALGHTITEATVRADLAGMGVQQFSRSYLNRRPTDDDEGWHVVSREDWEAAQWTE